MLLLYLLTLLQSVVYGAHITRAQQIARLAANLDRYHSSGYNQFHRPLILSPGWGFFQIEEGLALVFVGYGSGYVNKELIQEDIKTQPRSPTELPSARTTFRQVIDALREIGMSELSSKHNKELLIGGHSYGGILAQSISRMIFRFLIANNGKIPEEYNQYYVHVVSQLQKGVHTSFTERLLRDLLEKTDDKDEEKIYVPEFLVDKVIKSFPLENSDKKRYYFSKSAIRNGVISLDRQIVEQLFVRERKISVTSLGAPRFFPKGAVNVQRMMLPESYCIEMCKDPVPFLLIKGTFAQYYFQRVGGYPIGRVIQIETPANVTDPHSSESYLSALSSMANMRLFDWHSLPQRGVRLPTLGLLKLLLNPTSEAASQRGRGESTLELSIDIPKE